MKSSGLNFCKFLVTNGNFRLNDMRCDNSAICGFVWNLSEENSVLFVPVSKFFDWMEGVQRVWFSNFLCLTICLVCNRIFNFRRGKGSKKSHISVSNVEQSRATSLFPITGSSSTRRASKLYKYFGLKGLSHSLSLFSCFTSITFYLISLRF